MGRKPRAREPIYVIPFKNAGGSPAWRVSGMHQGRQVRENFKTEAEALVRKDELLAQRANLDSTVVRRPTRLTEEQIKEAELAFGELGGRPLLGAVRFYLANYRDPVNKITVREAFDRFIAGKRLDHLRPDSIRNLEVRVGFLATRHPDKLVSDLLADHLRELIFTAGRSAVTSDNVRRAFSSFFTWAAEHRFCASSPMAAIKPLKTERDEPEPLTVAQVRRLLHQAAAHRNGAVLPYVALSLFAGLRPTELARINWADIDLEGGTIKLGAKLATIRQRRLVELVYLTQTNKDRTGRNLPANLSAWLLPHAMRRTPIRGVNWRKDFDAVKTAAGWGTPSPKQPDLKPWTQDILRHTAISNHLAHFQHEGKTATWVGISPDILQRHYKGLVTQVDAFEFWSIVPDDKALGQAGKQ